MIRKSHGVALAALALAASGAFAQSSVKVYGMVEASFGAFKDSVLEGESQATPSLDSGAMQTSFIGFSGVEDLGGGLKAEFVLEHFFAADTGSTVTNTAGGFWGRGSWVGLSGGFGRVAFGQYDNPLFTFGYTYNPFGSSFAFSPTMRHYYYGRAGFTSGFDTGWVNSITYETPNLSGFTGIAQFAFKESSVSGSKNGVSLGGFYNAGPLSLGFVYVQAPVSTSPAGAWLQDDKVWALGVSYDLGMAKLFFQYTEDKAKKGVDDIDTPTAILDFGSTLKAKIFQLGASVPVSAAGTVLASYGQSKQTASGVEGSLKDTVFSLAYDHALSKRTDVYVDYTFNKKSSSGAFDADWKTGNTFAVGIRHNF